MSKGEKMLTKSLFGWQVDGIKVSFGTNRESAKVCLPSGEVLVEFRGPGNDKKALKCSESIQRAFMAGYRAALSDAGTTEEQLCEKMERTA